VIHRPEMGSWPHYIGTDQNRNFHLQGDRLILSDEETPPGGERRPYQITWERVSPTPSAERSYPSPDDQSITPVVTEDEPHHHVLFRKIARSGRANDHAGSSRVLQNLSTCAVHYFALTQQCHRRRQPVSADRQRQ
jgi:hypothetical protein